MADTRKPHPSDAAPYYLAARFVTQEATEKPYLEAQETIRELDVELSAYRFFAVQQLSWYVAMIGEAPPRDSTATTDDHFKSGGIDAATRADRCCIVGAAPSTNQTRAMGGGPLHIPAQEKAQTDPAVGPRGQEV